MHTPPDSLAPSSIHSTPYAKGSASHTNCDVDHTQGQYKHYLEHDIKFTEEISMDDFLKLLDNKDAPAYGEQYSELAESTQVKGLFEKYNQSGSKETDRYKPFSDLANYILEQLATPEETPIVVCCSDAYKARGSSGVRKPDCVFVSKKAFEQDLREKRPSPVPFYWAEVLAFVEFKKKDRTPSTNNTPAASSSRAGTRLNLPSAHTRDYRSMNHQAPSSASLVPLSSISITPKKRKTDNDANSETKRQKTAGLPGGDSIQCASYALEMLSRGGFRSHVFGICVTDDNFVLLYYDRSVLLRSKPIPFTTDPAALVAMLDCMRRLNDQQWGHVIVPHPLSAHSDKKGRSMGQISTKGDVFVDSFNPLDGKEFPLDNGVTLKLGEVIFQQHGLIGRGTCVLRAKVTRDPKGIAKGWKREGIVVKLSFTPEGRQAEGKKLDEIVKIAKQKNRGMLDHLPRVLHYQEIPREKMKIQDDLSKKFEGGYEYRGLQVLVMTELFPVTELETTATLAPVIRHVFECYKWVHETAKVIHRDISLNNIMYRKMSDGSLMGVLTDFDLALWRDQSEQGPLSKQRTGTQPYMAIDLLEQDPPPKHIYRFDLESILYVILVLTTRRDKGTEIRDTPLRHWFSADMKSLARFKRADLYDLPETTPQFTVFKRWTKRMGACFRDGYHSRAQHRDNLDEDYITGSPASPSSSNGQFNDETLGGHVTFEKFSDIFDDKIEHFRNAGAP